MKNIPKTINAWCMYDWAASVYSLVITSSIFPVYYSNVAVNEKGGDIIDFLGFQVKNSVLYSYTLSFIFLLIAIMNPILTSVADYSGKKKSFMQFFCCLGGVACSSLYFFETSTTTLAIFMLIFAGIGYSGSWVFYNSYLPDIATEDRFDKISARGFSMGYIGSVILLIFNLLMIMKPEFFGGISAGLASRLSFLSVGIWWILFAQYTFYHLPKGIALEPNGNHWLLNGFKELKHIYFEINKNLNMMRFLIAFFFFNMGVQTVMYIATIFAEKELHLPSSNLIATVLLLQLVAIPGAFIGSWLSQKYGNIRSLIIQVVCWIFICTSAYFVRNGLDFYLLAFAVGLVMGGVQSQSRSTYAKFIPENSKESASYFGFYEMTYALSIVIGTFMYGFIEAITGSARNSVIALGLFFIIGLIFLFVTRLPERNKLSV